MKTTKDKCFFFFYFNCIKSRLKNELLINFYARDPNPSLLKISSAMIIVKNVSNVITRININRPGYNLSLNLQICARKSRAMKKVLKTEPPTSLDFCRNTQLYSTSDFGIMSFALRINFDKWTLRA